MSRPMWTLGVDPGKRQMECVLLGPAEEVVLPAQTFDQDESGYARLWALLSEQVAAGDLLLIGVEASGALDKNLIGWLNAREAPFEIALFRLDPAQVKAFSGPRPIRGKTDKADAVRIARFTLCYHKRLRPFDYDEQGQVLGRLFNEREALVKDRAALYNRLQERLNLSFPEMGRVIEDVCCPLALAVLRLAPTAHHMRNIPARKLAKVQSGPRCPSLGGERAKQLKELAKRSIAGATGEHDGDAIVFLIGQIQSLGQRIGQIESVLSEQSKTRPAGQDLPGLPEQLDIVQSLPCVKIVTASALVLRCEGINRYPTAKAYGAQMGATPDRRQTGTTYDKGHLTRRCDRRTRPTLYLLTRNLTRFDPYFAFHKWRMIEEKKQTRQEAVCSCMHRTTTIIWNMVHKREQYSLKRGLENIIRHHGELWKKFLASPQATQYLMKKIPQEYRL